MLGFQGMAREQLAANARLRHQKTYHGKKIAPKRNGTILSDKSRRQLEDRRRIKSDPFALVAILLLISMFWLIFK